MSNWAVWKTEKNYQILFWSGVLNGAGNRFTQVAVLTLLYQLTASAAAIGLLFAVRMLPYLFFAPFGGMLADRFSKKYLLIVVDIIRAPIALLPILVLAMGADFIWLVYLSAFLLACGEAIYNPARMASIPLIVKQDRLLYINAIEQIMIGSVLIIGSSTGGLISYYLGLSAAFALDAFTFIVSGILLTSIKLNKSRPAERTETRKVPISSLIFGSALIMIFLFIEFTVPLANGIDNVLMSVYALDVFKMGDIGVGFIYACLGAGFVLSSLFSNVLKNKLLAFAIFCIAFEGVGHIMLGNVQTFGMALCIVIWITFVGGISDICITTLIMKLVPRSKQGTFFGLTSMISNTSLGLSMGIGGVLIDIFHPRTLSIYVGVTYIVLTFIYMILFSKVNIKSEKKKLRRMLDNENSIENM